MIIIIKKSTFDLPWNYLKLPKHKLSLLENKNPHLIFQSLNKQENSNNEVSLTQLLKKTQFLVETYITCSYISQLFLAIVDDLNWQFFLVRNRRGQHFSQAGSLRL